MGVVLYEMITLKELKKKDLEVY